MALTTALIDVSKRELKSRDVTTYADVVKHLDLSEAGIKRYVCGQGFHAVAA